MLLCQLQWMIFSPALCSYYDIHQLLIEYAPITRQVYLTLTNQEMPWSRDWNNDIVFGGKNTTSTFSFLVANRFMMARCVVFFKRSLNPNPSSTKYCFSLLGWSIGGTIHSTLSDYVVRRWANNFCFWEHM